MEMEAPPPPPQSFSMETSVVGRHWILYLILHFYKHEGTATKIRFISNKYQFHLCLTNFFYPFQLYELFNIHYVACLGHFISSGFWSFTISHAQLVGRSFGWSATRLGVPSGLPPAAHWAHPVLLGFSVEVMDRSFISSLNKYLLGPTTLLVIRNKIQNLSVMGFVLAYFGFLVMILNLSYWFIFKYFVISSKNQTFLLMLLKHFCKCFWKRSVLVNLAHWISMRRLAPHLRPWRTSTAPSSLSTAGWADLWSLFPV